MKNTDSPSDIAKRATKQRAERCKHFTGVQHDFCEMHVRYEDLERDGKMLPCLPSLIMPGKEAAACDKFATYTPEEIAAHEKELGRHLEVMAKVMESINPYREQVSKTKQGLGTVIDCAACGGKETLRLTISSYNGHAHVKCVNPGCDICWME